MLVLPGSHNKFVAMSEEGRIIGCMTSISGELLDAMTHHTILADAVGSAFVTPETYVSEMAMEGAWACSQSGLGRAAFSGRILRTLGKRSTAEIQSYLLGAALALDVQAMEQFLPDEPGGDSASDGHGDSVARRRRGTWFSADGSADARHSSAENLRCGKSTCTAGDD